MKIPPSHPLPPSLTFTLSSLPLSPSLGTLPVQSPSPSPGRTRLRRSLDSGAKAQAVPCRDHMDSGVLLSRVRALFFQLAESRLTSHSYNTNNTNNTNNNNQNPSVLCLQPIQQAG